MGKIQVKLFSKKLCKRIAYAAERDFSEFKYIPSNVYGGTYFVVPTEEPELFIKVSSEKDSSDESFIPIPPFFVERIVEC